MSRTPPENCGQWRVFKADSGKPVEVHASPEAAYRAALLLSAHELKNGRGADYTVKPPTFCTPSDLTGALALPTWAITVLKEYEVL